MTEDQAINLMTHIVHTIVDFRRANDERQFESMSEVWKEFVAYQVKQLEEYENRTTVGYDFELSAFRRWIIVNAANRSLAWSGLQWVMHEQGAPVEGVQICNFSTKEEAMQYAAERRIV